MKEIKQDKPRPTTPKERPKSSDLDTSVLRSNKTKYHQIAAGVAWYKLLFNYILTFPYHFKRSVLAGSLLHNIAGWRERRHLFRLMPVPDCSSGVLNMLAWRRSSGLVMMISTFAMIYFSFMDVQSSFQRTEWTVQLSDAPLIRLYPNQSDYLSADALKYFKLDSPHDPGYFQEHMTEPGNLQSTVLIENFLSYSSRMFRVAVALMLRRVALMLAMVDAAVLVCLILAFLLNAGSVITWDRYPRSRKLLLAGWYAIRCDQESRSGFSHLWRHF